MAVKSFERMPETPQRPPENLGDAAQPHYEAALAELLATFRPERALVLVHQEGRFQAAAFHGFAVSDPANLIALPVSMTLLHQVLASQEPLACRDVQRQAGPNPSFSLAVSQIRSVICAPFWTPEEDVGGLLYVDSRLEEHDFNQPSHADRELAQKALRSRMREVAEALEQRLRHGRTLPKEESRGAGRAPARPAPKAPVAPEVAALRPSGSAMVVFFRSLTAMFRAGIPLARALNVLGRFSEGRRPARLAWLLGYSSEDRRLIRIVQELHRLVSQGWPLSAAMRLFPRAFPPTLVELVLVGETTGGGLDKALEAAADLQEELHATARRLQSTLTYPVFVLALVVAALMILPSFLAAGPLRMVAESGGTLPWPSRLLLGLSAGLGHPVTWVGLLGLGWAVRRALAQPERQRQVYRLALRLPVAGPMLRLFGSVRFCQALALLYQSGIPLQDSLRLAAGASLSPWLRERLPELVDRVLYQGQTLAQAMRGMEFFPGPMVEFVVAGEESGQLPALLRGLARYYADDLEARQEVALALLEPLLMLGLGLLVAAFLVAMMLPMMQVLQTL